MRLLDFCKVICVLCFSFTFTCTASTTISVQVQEQDMTPLKHINSYKFQLELRKELLDTSAKRFSNSAPNRPLDAKEECKFELISCHDQLSTMLPIDTIMYVLSFLEPFTMFYVSCVNKALNKIAQSCMEFRLTELNPYFLLTNRIINRLSYYLLTRELEKVITFKDHVYDVIELAKLRFISNLYLPLYKSKRWEMTSSLIMFYTEITHGLGTTSDWEKENLLTHIFKNIRRKYNLHFTIAAYDKMMLSGASDPELLRVSFAKIVKYLKIIDSRQSNLDESTADLQDIITNINSPLQNSHEIVKFCRLVILDHIYLMFPDENIHHLLHVFLQSLFIGFIYKEIFDHLQVSFEQLLNFSKLQTYFDLNSYKYILENIPEPEHGNSKIMLELLSHNCLNPFTFEENKVEVEDYKSFVFQLLKSSSYGLIHLDMFSKLVQSGIFALREMCDEHSSIVLKSTKHSSVDFFRILLNESPTPVNLFVRTWHNNTPAIQHVLSDFFVRNDLKDTFFKELVEKYINDEHRDPFPLLFCHSSSLTRISHMIRDQFILTNRYIFDGDDLAPLGSFIQIFSGRIMSFKEIIREFELSHLMEIFSSDPEVFFNESDPETTEPPISVSRFINTGVIGPQL